MMHDHDLIKALLDTGMFGYGSNSIYAKGPTKGPSNSIHYTQTHLMSIPKEEIPVVLATGKLPQSDTPFYQTTRLILELRLQGVLP